MSEEVTYKIERQRREIKIFGKTFYLYVEQKVGKKISRRRIKNR